MTPRSSKRPNPKKDKSARRQRGTKPGTFTAGFLDPSHSARLDRLTLQAKDTPPESLLAVLLTLAWTGAQSGQNAHHCVDACRTLGHALGYLGVATELRATGVVIHHQRTGQMTSCAPQMPTWRNRNVLDGHCVLSIPDQGRWIDATIEQFPGLSQLRVGPAVGRFGAYLDPTTGETARAEMFPGRPPAGTSVAVPRGDRMVVYTLSPDTANKVITEHPTVTEFAAQHRRAALNLLAITLDGFRDRQSSLGETLRQIPLPRLQALFDAIGDAPMTRADNRDALFTLDGRPLRLGEIPLPDGIPPAVTPI